MLLLGGLLRRQGLVWLLHATRRLNSNKTILKSPEDRPFIIRYKEDALPHDSGTAFTSQGLETKAE